ncbi:MAG: hypothetical protein QM696_06515 [Steroidobacteraceae bacterium]
MKCPIFAVAVFSMAAVPAGPAPAAQENGYEVTRSETVLPVPANKVGRKILSRETKVGSTAETDGNSQTFTMTLGGFMDKCPMVEAGSPVKFVVPGDFEYIIVADTVDTDVVPTERKHYMKTMKARIKVFVNDDLSVTDGEMEGTFTSDMDGVRTGPVSVRRPFRIEKGGGPNLDDLKEITRATGDLAAAGLMANASMTIIAVQRDWYKPNACSEVQLDPPSESRTVGPGETVEIHVTYRTKDSRQPIPKGEWTASAVGAGARLEATQGKVREDGTFVVKYTAGSNPREGDGARIEALSPAGAGQGLWKIRIGGDYEVRFESTISSRNPVESVRSSAQGSVRLTSSTKPWKRKPDGKQYLLYDGNGTVRFNTAAGPERVPCAPLISGSGSSSFQVMETWIQITPPEQAGGRGRADVQMTYWIAEGAGETEMTPNRVNYQCVPGDSDPYSYWQSSYLSGRQPNGDINFLTNWEYVGEGDVVARKVLSGNCGGTCSEERSVFTLRRVSGGK